MSTTPWLALLLGLLLGVRHAFDADHLVAVSTIVSEYRNPLRALWVGVSWGLGHTTTLLLAGVLILFARISFPKGVALFFEFLVGVMLVVLGLQIFWNFRKGKFHLHPHEHKEASHLHFHSHEETPEHIHHTGVRWNNFVYFLIAGITPGEHRQQRVVGPGRPFFRVKSYMVGTVHGLAGSAALLLLAVAALDTPWTGALYILLFGLGSIASMGIVTIFISVPFTASARLPRLNRLVQTAAATMSILFGVLLMYEIGIVEGLFRAS
ncbi:MAG: urease accessory protein UreH [Chloroflexi bacterium]|nr:urease accessory protein UreH [Chloroflexota bacterium]